MSDNTLPDNFWEELEKIFRTLGTYTIFDILKEAFPEEYSLHLTWHEEEINTLKNRLGRQPTNKRKKKMLFSELDLNEQYFQEDEFRQVFEDFAQTHIDKLIDKVKEIYPNFQKTSRWLQMSHDDKMAFLAIKNLPNDIFGENLDPKLVFKKFLRHPSLKKPFEELEKGKVKKNSFNGKILNFAKEIFIDHFQLELNKYIQSELKKFLPESDYQLTDDVEVVERVSLPQIEWKGTQGQLAELFVELQRKGWINPIPTQLISRYFTKSNSISQVLKPAQDPKTKENTYEGIYKPKYSPRFDAIRQNPDNQ